MILAEKGIITGEIILVSRCEQVPTCGKPKSESFIEAELAICFSQSYLLGETSETCAPSRNRCTSHKRTKDTQDKEKKQKINSWLSCCKSSNLFPSHCTAG